MEPHDEQGHFRGKLGYVRHDDGVQGEGVWKDPFQDREVLSFIKDLPSLRLCQGRLVFVRPLLHMSELRQDDRP